MNVFMLNDGWADCGCGVPYTEGVFESPNSAMSYVLAKELKEHTEKRDRYIKHHGTSLVNGEEYPGFSAPAWRATIQTSTVMFSYTDSSGRWTIEEVVVR
jgi:hypothetical protein